MDIFVKSIAFVLVTAILGISLKHYGKEVGFLLIVVATCMVAISAFSYLQPVVSFLEKLQNLGGIDNEMIRILLKTVGITLLSELSMMICTDAGSGALGKSIQFLSSAALLWIALPALEELLLLITNILEGK